MEYRTVFTEDAYREQWNLLSSYIYPSNVVRYFEKTERPKPSEEVVEQISGSIAQAKEYFATFSDSSIQISPLLLYYGATNLLHGVAQMLSGSPIVIKNHGMRLPRPTSAMRIADVQVIPTDPDTGALSVFARTLLNVGDATSSGSWRILDVLASVLEVQDYFLDCYPEELPNVIPIHVTRLKRSRIESLRMSDISRFECLEDVLSRIDGFKKNYLHPQVSFHGDEVGLRTRLNGESLSRRSLTGQMYLELGTRRGSKYIHFPLELKLYIGLYALGYLCRYHPEVWNPFVRTDTTGERLLIEHFLSHVRRVLPNITLDLITGRRNIFVSQPQGTTDLSSTLTEDEVAKIAAIEARKALDREKMRINER